jgi:hypothetical protein
VGTGRRPDNGRRRAAVWCAHDAHAAKALRRMRASAC